MTYAHGLSTTKHWLCLIQKGGTGQLIGRLTDDKIDVAMCETFTIALSNDVNSYEIYPVPLQTHSSPVLRKDHPHIS